MYTVIGVQIRPTFRTLAFAEYILTIFTILHLSFTLQYSINYEKMHMYLDLYTSVEIVGVSI